MLAFGVGTWSATSTTTSHCWRRGAQGEACGEEMGYQNVAARLVSRLTAWDYLVVDLPVGYLVKNPFMYCLFGWVLAAGGI